MRFAYSRYKIGRIEMCFNRKFKSSIFAMIKWLKISYFLISDFFIINVFLHFPRKKELSNFFTKVLNLPFQYWLWFKPIFNNFDLFVLHFDILGQDDIAYKVNLILIEPIFFKIDKKAIFSQNIYYLLNNCHMILVRIFSINKDIIQIYDNKNVKLFGQNLIDIILKSDQGIR